MFWSSFTSMVAFWTDVIDKSGITFVWSGREHFQIKEHWFHFLKYESYSSFGNFTHSETNEPSETELPTVNWNSFFVL